MTGVLGRRQIVTVRTHSIKQYTKKCNEKRRRLFACVTRIVCTRTNSSFSFDVVGTEMINSSAQRKAVYSTAVKIPLRSCVTVTYIYKQL